MARARLVARVGAQTISVAAECRGRLSWSAELRHGDGVGVAEALASLSETVTRNRLPRRLVALVEPPLLQRRTLSDLPPVRQVELNQLVARAAPRFFRQNGHPLVSAAAWEDGSPPRRIARAAAVEVDIADAIVAGAGKAGLFLEDIQAAGGNPILSLLPPAERDRRRANEWRGVLRLAGLVAALWLAVGVVAQVRLQVESRQINAELARLREPRQALVAARLAMDSAGDMLSAIDRAQAGRTRLSTHLALLVQALPDSTFLGSLALDSSGAGTATGRTRSVTALIKTLDKTAGVGPARLEGIAVRDTVAGVEWERFSLRLGSEPKP